MSEKINYQGFPYMLIKIVSIQIHKSSAYNL